MLEDIFSICYSAVGVVYWAEVVTVETHMHAAQALRPASDKRRAAQRLPACMPSQGQVSKDCVMAPAFMIFMYFMHRSCTLAYTRIHVLAEYSWQQLCSALPARAFLIFKQEQHALVNIYSIEIGKDPRASASTCCILLIPNICQIVRATCYA